MILPDLSGIRPSLSCRLCEGAWRSLGPESRWVPHQVWCPRNPVKNVEAADPIKRGVDRGYGDRRLTGAKAPGSAGGDAPPLPASTDFPRYGLLRWPEHGWSW